MDGDFVDGVRSQSPGDAVDELDVACEGPVFSAGHNLKELVN